MTEQDAAGWGWALTPQSNRIDAEQFSVELWVEGQKNGLATFDQVRTDVAVLFPGYANSRAAGGFFSINALHYPNGLHSLQRVVQDTGGNREGVGSRYFYVLNSPRILGEEAASPDMEMTTENLESLRAIPDWPDDPPPFRRGFSENALWMASQAGKSGKPGLAFMSVRELERIEINLGCNFKSIRGYSLDSEGLGLLPVGSALDVENGLFCWQPGAGFLRKYSLVFVVTDGNDQNWKQRVEILIMPQFNGNPPGRSQETSQRK